MVDTSDENNYIRRLSTDTENEKEDPPDPGIASHIPDLIPETGDARQDVLTHPPVQSGLQAPVDDMETEPEHVPVKKKLTSVLSPNVYACDTELSDEQEEFVPSYWKCEHCLKVSQKNKYFMNPLSALSD